MSFFIKVTYMFLNSQTELGPLKEIRYNEWNRYKKISHVYG